MTDAKYKLADAFTDVSAFTDTYANARMYAQHCVHADMFVNASTDASVCIFGRIRGYVHVHMSLLRCLCGIQSFPIITLLGKRREGGGSSWLSHRYLEHQVDQCGS